MADIQLAPATGHVEKVGENRVSLIKDTAGQQGLMTRFILSLSGKKEETIRDIPHIIGKVLNSPEMQAITRDAVGLALERISGRRIKWLIGCNEHTIYWIFAGYPAGLPATRLLRRPIPCRPACRRRPGGYTSSLQMRRRENSLSAPPRATVAASGLTANLMIGYLNNSDTPQQIRGVAPRMGPTDMETRKALPLPSRNSSRSPTRQMSDWTNTLRASWSGSWAHLPELSKLIGVATLVTNRINSFVVKDVGELVLSISGKHLGWINWFCAGLGAITGLIRLGISPPP